MSEDKLEILRHSCAHLMAAAVFEMFPEAKFAIGPAVDNGFYYDFDLPRTLIPEDLPLIEEKMKDLAKKDMPFEKSEVETKKAIELMKKSGQDYKVELLEEMPSEKVSFYKTGNFVDLCRGPHVKSTGEIEHFKLLSIAGAYWRGDEKKTMLQRIYGTCFPSKDELQKYLENLESAKKNDHRKLGKDLDLFVMSDLVGPGLPLYTPKGTILRNLIIDYSRSLRKEIGYEEVQTPQINKSELFKVSGHYEQYKDSMFSVSSNYTKEEYFLKPMNCPQHTQIYAAKLRSYKDLPIRVADFSTLYRDEKPGELNGLVRLRAFSQDDGHCFCREDQIEEEVDALLGVIKKALGKYELQYFVRLSLRDETQKEKYIGSDETWQKYQTLLEKLLVEKKIDFIKAEGEAAFYGPKMDIISKDSLGREWQLCTLQLDPNMPNRFGLKYIGEDGKEHMPIMIHSALIGSPERFMGMLIEHYAGVFPLWLAPVQAIVLPVSDQYNDYAKEVAENLVGVRVQVDSRNESVGRKIREAQSQKIPIAIVVGEKEKKSKFITVREYGSKELKELAIGEFLKRF